MAEPNKPTAALTAETFDQLLSSQGLTIRSEDQAAALLQAKQLQAQASTVCEAEHRAVEADHDAPL